MALRHRDFAASVPVVLREERRERLPRPPPDAQLWVEQDRIARGPYAIVELEVLIGKQRLIPAVHLPHDLDRIGTKRHVIGLLLSSSKVVQRVADADPAAKRRRDCPPLDRICCANLAAADTAPRTFLEPVYGPSHV